jgi:hypothetical protein
VAGLRMQFRSQLDYTDENAPAMDAEEEAKIAEKIQVLDSWGSFETFTTDPTTKRRNYHKSVQEQAKALEHGWEVARTARNGWYHKELFRLMAQRVMAQKVIDQVGQGTYDKLADIDGVTSKLGQFTVETLDFEGMLSSLLGREHELTRRWALAITKAFNAKAMDMARARDRFDSMLARAFPNMNRLQRAKANYRLHSVRNVGIEIFESRVNTTLTAEQRALMAAAGDTVEKIRKEVKISENTAMFMTMLAKQNQYKEGMALAGWTAEVMARIEKQLSPAAKIIRDHLWEEYRQGYFPLAEIYREEFGVDLPQLTDYSPGRFFNSGREKPMDPSGMGVLSGGGMQDGFLNTRKMHTAKPDFHDAQALYWGHTNQSLHWQHLAPVLREIRGVFRNPEIKAAVKAAWGKKGNGLIESRLQALEGNGIMQDAGVMDDIINWFSSRFAVGKLAMNLGTGIKNLSTAFYPGLDLDVKEWQQGFGELVVNPAIYRQIYESEAIQARLKGGTTPEQRAVLENFWNSSPGPVKEALIKGMEMHSVIDSVALSSGAAIAYSAYYKRAMEADPNMTPEQADALAMDEMTLTVARVAQPVTVDRKSMVGLRMNAMGKLMWMFSSDAGQKTALLLEAWRNVLTRGKKVTKRDLRVIFYSHLVLGAMWTTLNSIVKDLRDGDDDPEDDPAWEWENYLLGAVLGPLGGLPLMGELLGWISAKLSGGKAYGSGGTNVIAEPGAAVLGSTAEILDKLMDDKPDDPEEFEKDVLRALDGLGGAPGVAQRLYKDSKLALDAAGVIEDEEQKKKKKRAAALKKKKEEAKD